MRISDWSSDVCSSDLIGTTLRLLGRMGVQSEHGRDGVVQLNAAQVHTLEAPYELVKTMRASILVLGPLLSRFGEARVSLPGGCAIGQRPVDQHIKGLEAMGAGTKIDTRFVVTGRAAGREKRGQTGRGSVGAVTRK